MTRLYCACGKALIDQDLDGTLVLTARPLLAVNGQTRARCHRCSRETRVSESLLAELAVAMFCLGAGEERSLSLLAGTVRYDVSVCATVVVLDSERVPM